MQVGKVNLVPTLREFELDKIKSPTESASRPANAFDSLPSAGNSEISNAFQNLSIANARYGSQLSAFETAKQNTDKITSLFNSKVTDVNSAQRDHSSTLANIDQITGSIKTITNSISGSDSILGTYSDKINATQARIGGLDAEVGQIEMGIIVNENATNNYRKHEERKKQLSDNYGSSLTKRNSLLNGIKSAEDQMLSIDSQIASLDALDAVDPLGQANPSGKNEAKARLMEHRKDAEEKFLQLCKELTENEKVISDFEESEAVVNKYAESDIAQLEGKNSILKASKHQLQAKKSSEQLNLADLMGRKSIFEKDLSSAKKALDNQQIRLQTAQQNEVKLNAKLTQQNEELNIIQSTFGTESADYAVKSNSLERAENEVVKSTNLFNLVTKNHIAKRK